MAKIYGERWETVESLDEGGQAFTFVVKDIEESSDETYLLKRLKNPDRIERFRNEVEAGLRLDHKNIVDVIDSDLDAPQPYIVSSHYKVEA